MNLLDQAQEIRLADDGSLPTRLKIFPEGRYRHPQGRLNFDENFHQKIVSSVNGRARKISPFIDTNHDRGEANGWIQNAEYVKGDGTYINVKWTPRGERLLRDGSYKYVSPDFAPFENPREGSNEKYELALNAVSLTNVPYLKDLPAVVLSEIMLADDDGADDEDTPNGGNPTTPSRKTATRKNPDPDDDGDDDSTAAGDTDHDYQGPDGKRKPRSAKMNDSADTIRSEGVVYRFSDGSHYSLAAEHLTKSDRDAIDEDDFAGPHKSFPVTNQHEAKAAWDLAGHAANPDAVRARIRAIAKRKGFSLPDTASKSKDTKMADENPNAQAPAVQLADVMTKLGESEQERVALAEQVKAITAQLTEARIESDIRQLSETREIEVEAEDGTKTAARTPGLPNAVLSESKKFMLAHPETREEMLAILKLMQQIGTVNLTEVGHAGTGVAGDPIAATLSDHNPEKADEARWERANQLAKTQYQKPLTQLSEREQLALLKLAEKPRV